MRRGILGSRREHLSQPEDKPLGRRTESPGKGEDEKTDSQDEEDIPSDADADFFEQRT
jgi:hypothetical protein